MSNLKKSIAAAVLALTAAGAANATSVTECLGKISTLSTETQGAKSPPLSSRDENGLLGKLANAYDKLDHAKNADAIQKLTDFYNQVNALWSAPKTKIDPADAQTLSSGAQDAIDCIRNIQ